ncbi:FGGY-family carbohydrate kinase [Sphaerotilus sp.]|uniref:FGGY-family carbohydrate kinase n=1 Tax=Sphaerotilus sp. TaxID=2093942 RepID=UPI002ACDBAAB|nr:FGGY family carbohydrate kinase [Sphaerotilus sp.]MDZ7854648.1 FGGY family carbohydrate kinase [Sphaerotilus sp.]
MVLRETLTLVLDIGKSNAKLVLIDADGEVLVRTVQANTSVDGPGYIALGVAALEDWLLRTIPQLPRRDEIGVISITTHGAAFCGLDGDGLALPPIDYEWDGYGETRAHYAAAVDPFVHNGTPLLPSGLNAGLSLYWLQQARPALWARAQQWLPYPQYWAWWFSGVACSEVSSLGCHTALWAPAEGRYSDWAQRSGIAERFAPLRQADERIGRLRSDLAHRLRLPSTVQVCAGSHDSNACLARYLGSEPDATVVSTGTWCVLMAPGAPTAGLDATRDQLVNVAVDGRAVPTARFMGGREFAALCERADPAWADEAALTEVLHQGWLALPGFAAAGGPYAPRTGSIWRGETKVMEGLGAVPERLRPALAALYCAEVTLQLATELEAGSAPRTLVLEGPLAHNAAYLCAVQALAGPRAVLLSNDPLEGTARGAWLLAHTAPTQLTAAKYTVKQVDSTLARAICAHSATWSRLALGLS